MSFVTGLGRALSILSFALGGAGTDRRTFTITAPSETVAEDGTATDEVLVLPVTPWKYEIESGQLNKVVNISQLGEALIFGQPKLRTLKTSCFFPLQEHDYPFVVGSDKSPTECVELITKWKENKKPVRVVISDSPVNLSCAITDFDYREQEGTRDIYYDLTFKEYKELTIKSANENKQTDETTGLKERQTEKPQASKAAVTDGSDILDAAKKAYGDYKHWRRVAEGNNLKDLAINNANKIRKLKIPKL